MKEWQQLVLLSVYFSVWLTATDSPLNVLHLLYIQSMHSMYNWHNDRALVFYCLHKFKPLSVTDTYTHTQKRIYIFKPTISVLFQEVKLS